MPPGPDFPQLLRAAGLRVTRQRLAVLDVLVELAHADTESVIAGVRRDLPEVSHQAVYDSLATSPASATTTITSSAAPAARSPTSTAPSATSRA